MMKYSHFNIRTDFEDLFENLKKIFVSKEVKINEKIFKVDLEPPERNDDRMEFGLRFSTSGDKGIEKKEILEFLIDKITSKFSEEERSVIFIELFKLGVGSAKKVSIQKFIAQTN